MVGAWVRLLVNSALVAAIAVAAQLGAGDALGILQWDGPHDARAWTTLLTWLAFAYAVAVLAGAMVGRIAVRRHGGDGVGSRLTASLVAAGGAAAAIGLAWIPAQFLRPPTNVNPGLVVSLTAGAGVIVGLVLAMLALAARPIAIGLEAMAAWVWLVAIGAAAAALATNEPFAAPRPGVPDAPSVLPTSPWTGPRALIIAAALIGLLVSGIARWRGAGRLGAALSGFGGPALVCSAYLIAGPGESTGSLDEPYIAAVLAAAAGLVASVLVAMPGRRVARTVRLQAPSDEAPIEGDVIEAVRTSTTPAPPTTTAQGHARPAWAGGSGPLARAYAGASTATTREPATVVARGTGWDAGTLDGTTGAGRHAQRQEGHNGGIYRSTSTEPADEIRSEPWLPDLRPTGRSSGRHAAGE